MNLMFWLHIKHLKTKRIQRLNIIKALSNTSWCRRISILMIYISVIRSELDHESSVYCLASISSVKMLKSSNYNEHHLMMECFERHHPLNNTKIKFCWIPRNVRSPNNERVSRSCRKSFKCYWKNVYCFIGPFITS